MKTTPNLALAYPEPTDNTQTWKYWQSLAEQIDALLAPSCVTASSGQHAVSGWTQVPLSNPIALKGGWTLNGQGALVVPDNGIYLVTMKGFAGVSMGIGAAVNWGGEQYPSLVIQGNDPSGIVNAVGQPMVLAKGDRIYGFAGGSGNISTLALGVFRLSITLPANGLADRGQIPHSTDPAAQETA